MATRQVFAREPSPDFATERPKPPIVRRAQKLARGSRQTHYVIAAPVADAPAIAATKAASDINQQLELAVRKRREAEYREQQKAREQAEREKLRADRQARHRQNEKLKHDALERQRMSEAQQAEKQRWASVISRKGLDAAVAKRIEERIEIDKAAREAEEARRKARSRTAPASSRVGEDGLFSRHSQRPKRAGTHGSRPVGALVYAAPTRSVINACTTLTGWFEEPKSRGGVQQGGVQQGGVQQGGVWSGEALVSSEASCSSSPVLHAAGCSSAAASQAGSSTALVVVRGCGVEESHQCWSAAAAESQRRVHRSERARRDVLWQAEQHARLAAEAARARYDKEERVRLKAATEERRQADAVRTNLTTHMLHPPPQAQQLAQLSQLSLQGQQGPQGEQGEQKDEAHQEQAVQQAQQAQQKSQHQHMAAPRKETSHKEEAKERGEEDSRQVTVAAEARRVAKLAAAAEAAMAAAVQLACETRRASVVAAEHAAKRRDELEWRAKQQARVEAEAEGRRATREERRRLDEGRRREEERRRQEEDERARREALSEAKIRQRVDAIKAVGEQKLAELLQSREGELSSATTAGLTKQEVMTFCSRPLADPCLLSPRPHLTLTFHLTFHLHLALILTFALTLTLTLTFTSPSPHLRPQPQQVSSPLNLPGLTSPITLAPHDI